MSGRQLSAVKGKLDSLVTGHGGGDLLLEVRVGAASFTQNGISENNRVYAQALNFRDGQCVVFTGAIRGLSAGFEKSRVCDLDFKFIFHSVGDCL